MPVSRSPNDLEATAFARRPRRRFGLVLAVVFALTAALATHIYHLFSAPAPQATRQVEFEIEPGWGANRVADALADEGLIRHRQLFTLWLRFRQIDRALGEGVYELGPNMNMAEVAQVLEQGGQPRVASVVVPEGFRAGEVAARLAAAEVGPMDEFLRLIQDPGELRPEFLPEGAGLEGYLFPASYDIPVRSGPGDAIAAMLGRFERELDDGTLASLEALGLTVHDWVTLASIVQAEAANDEEMPVIAGVFLNRLDEDMLLQSDPTVAYGLGIRMNELNRYEGHFTVSADHPWNTYTRPGLPAGPIGNPGREALASVLNASRVNAEGQPNLYFMHSRDGSVFKVNTNLEDHERDVARYLRP